MEATIKTNYFVAIMIANNKRLILILLRLQYLHKKQMENILIFKRHIS